MKLCDGDCDEMPLCDCAKCSSGPDEEFGKCRECQKETEFKKKTKSDCSDGQARTRSNFDCVSGTTIRIFYSVGFYEQRKT